MTENKYKKRLRVLVCGSRFGQFYLEALKLLPESEYEIVGLFAQGSDRSQIGANHYQIPLYTDINQLPADIDLACVVIRSSVMGGVGTDLADDEIYQCLFDFGPGGIFRQFRFDLVFDALGNLGGFQGVIQHQQGVVITVIGAVILPGKRLEISCGRSDGDSPQAFAGRRQVFCR